jgi:hypothetical protein
MSGRGDNNKRGSSGRGASNQSNQAFGQSEKVGKSNRGEQKGQPSKPQHKSEDPSANRDHSTKKEQK